jgi:hypothetical protein
MKAVSILLLLLGIALGCSGSEEDLRDGTPAPSLADGEPPTATPCQASDPSCVPSEPEPNDLSPDQIALAQHIADADPVLTELLADAAYESNVGYRADLGVDGTFVSIEYAFTQPLHVSADLPHIDTGHRGGEDDPTQIALPSPGYIIETSHDEIQAWSLMVIVLLDEEQVVEILPLPFGPHSGPPTDSS